MRGQRPDYEYIIEVGTRRDVLKRAVCVGCRTSFKTLVRCESPIHFELRLYGQHTNDHQPEFRTQYPWHNDQLKALKKIKSDGTRIEQIFHTLPDIFEKRGVTELEATRKLRRMGITRCVSDLGDLGMIREFISEFTQQTDEYGLQPDEDAVLCICPPNRSLLLVGEAVKEAGVTSAPTTEDGTPFC